MYIGAQCTIAAISTSKQTPSLLSHILNSLSILPAQIEENKRSATRAGALTALSRAKVWQSELNPAELATGCPGFKEYGSAFYKKDFAACVKAVRPLASLLAEEMNLSKYSTAYTAENQKMPTPAYKVADLISPIRKHTFALDIDPSELFDDDAEFQALTGNDWSSHDFQTVEEEEEPPQDDPKASN